MFGRKKEQTYKRLPESVNIPVALYQSMRGRYFVGYADNLNLGKGKSAWARLYNPPNSGVNLYVNVWKVTDLVGPPIRMQIWINAQPPGTPTESELVTPANTAIRPLPRPKVRLELASNIEGNPTRGIKAFVRRGQPETTIVVEEEGKFIFPPGGSFMILLSDPEAPNQPASGRIAFGWWEESCD